MTLLIKVCQLQYVRVVRIVRVTWCALLRADEHHPANIPAATSHGPGYLSSKILHPGSTSTLKLLQEATNQGCRGLPGNQTCAPWTTYFRASPGLSAPGPASVQAAPGAPATPPSPAAEAPAAVVMTPPSPLPTTEVTPAPEAPAQVATETPPGISQSIPAFPSLETLPSNVLAAG